MASAFYTATLTAPDNQAFSKGTEFLRTTDTVPTFFHRWLGFGISMPIVLSTFFALYYNLVWKKRRQENSDGASKLLESNITMAESTDRPEEAVNEPDNPSPDDRIRTGGEAQQASNDHPLKDDDSFRKLLPAMLAGAIFAVGLAVSQMVLPSKILGFLNLFLLAQGSYDPTLAIVMIGGCLVSWISYQFVKPFGLYPCYYARECPLLVHKFSVPTNAVVDSYLVVGALCFGIGWGVAGLCPGPALFLAATGTQPVIFCWWPAFLVGSLVAERIKR
jgi:uncharacterized membrane protein YedE/YeeE